MFAQQGKLSLTQISILFIWIEEEKEESEEDDEEDDEGVTKVPDCQPRNGQRVALDDGGEVQNTRRNRVSDDGTDLQSNGSFFCSQQNQSQSQQSQSSQRGSEHAGGGNKENSTNQMAAAAGLSIVDSSQARDEVSERAAHMAQEMRLGNVINCETERARVGVCTRETIFAVCPFPGESGFKFSDWCENMPDTEKHKPHGLICRMVLFKFGEGITQRQDWWSMVVTEARRGMSRRRSKITEGAKEVHNSE